jgi:hypothetical protein
MSSEICTTFISDINVPDPHDDGSEHVVLDGGIGIALLGRLPPVLAHAPLEARPARHPSHRRRLGSVELLASLRRRCQRDKVNNYFRFIEIVTTQMLSGQDVIRIRSCKLLVCHARYMWVGCEVSEIATPRVNYQ